jgi:hypothetical protein
MWGVPVVVIPVSQISPFMVDSWSIPRVDSLRLNSQ